MTAASVTATIKEDGTGMDPALCVPLCSHLQHQNWYSAVIKPNSDWAIWLAWWPYLWKMSWNAFCSVWSCLIRTVKWNLSLGLNQKQPFSFWPEVFLQTQNLTVLHFWMQNIWAVTDCRWKTHRWLTHIEARNQSPLGIIILSSLASLLNQTTIPLSLDPPWADVLDR